MANIDLTTKYIGSVDELYSRESSASLITNQDYSWQGAKAIKVYKVTTVAMSDYDRAGTGPSASRYGTLQSLDATTQTLTLTKDRSFTFAIDKLDADETQRALDAGRALARQQREVIHPEVEAYTYAQMALKAGTKATAAALTASNIYGHIMKASTALDNALVPDNGRYLIVTPDVYQLIKLDKSFMLNTDVAQEMRASGVVARIDGAQVIKVPAARLPKAFGFMMAHSSATVAPMKLSEYKVHNSPPGISGDLVEGRINYGAFILENKAKAIYYHPKA